MNCETIPPITHSLGRYWDQPPAEEVAVMQIDQTHALLTKRAFRQLQEYTQTLPSGVYAGKMWKAQDGGRWMLRWYGIVPGRCDVCSNNQREILIV